MYLRMDVHHHEHDGEWGGLVRPLWQGDLAGRLVAYEYVCVVHDPLELCQECREVNLYVRVGVFDFAFADVGLVDRGLASRDGDPPEAPNAVDLLGGEGLERVAEGLERLGAGRVSEHVFDVPCLPRVADVVVRYVVLVGECRAESACASEPVWPRRWVA